MKFLYGFHSQQRVVGKLINTVSQFLLLSSSRCKKQTNFAPNKVFFYQNCNFSRKLIYPKTTQHTSQQQHPTRQLPMSININLNPEEIDVDLTSAQPKPASSQPNQEDRKQEYIVSESTGILNFSSFRGDPLNFIIDGDNTLIIKEYKSLKRVTDKHLIKLQNLYTKVDTLNNIPKQTSTSLWKKITGGVSAVVNSFKCKPKYLLIKKVMVNLNQCSEVGDKGVKALTDFIKNFENIEYLEFEVNNTSATDESLAFISSLLGSLKRLTYFYIDFSGCRISDEGLFILSSVLKQKQNLKEIWLRFSWCTLNRISNEGIISVSKAVEYCRKLNVLLMEFNGHYDITSKGLSAVFGAVETLKSLRKLYTYFERAQASDNFLIYSGEVLQKLKKLRVFGLNLAGSNCITAKGFEKIEKALFLLSGLKDGLYMYFSGCLGPFDQDKIKRLLGALAKKRGIKNYVLEF